MRAIALTIEYDGTDFAGSQYQDGQRTVQSELEAAWQRLTGETRRWTFAGRTDSGVHARGQVVHTRTETHHTLPTVQRALNALLPSDIGVREVREADAEFHARYSAWRREYRYVILNEREGSPLLRRYALHVPEELDVGSMDQSIRVLIGEHDFATFGTVAHGSTVRQCFEARCAPVEENGRHLVTVELAANGFLRHMVRAIVGTLLLVGRGRWDATKVEQILRSRDRAASGPTAPPHGLYLEAVRYPPSVWAIGPSDGNSAHSGRH